MPSLTVTYVSGLSVTDVSGSYPGAGMRSKALAEALFHFQIMAAARRVGKSFLAPQNWTAY